MRLPTTKPALICCFFAALLLVACSGPSREKTKNGRTRVTLLTDWKPQAEHGGYYQALAESLYAKRGIDVVIRSGGPSVTVAHGLAAGDADFAIGSNPFTVLNLRREGAKIRAVMAVFQRDPQVLLTHPRRDIKSIADMKGKPILLSEGARATYWVWLKARFGFTENQVRRYTFDLRPFLTNPNAIQEAYVTSEPYSIEKASGIKPQIFPLADAGYPGYSNLLIVHDSLISQSPELVQAFVDASIEGWRSYLYGDPSPGNALIMSENPEMEIDVITQAIDKMKRYGIVGHPDSAGRDLGTMTDERWKVFFETMSGGELYPKTTPYKEAYTLEFLAPKATSRLPDDKQPVKPQ